MKWTPQQYADYLKRQKRTPDPVAQLPAAQQQPDPAPALGRKPPRRQVGACRPQCIVTITTYRCRLLDEDNVRAAGKACEDWIAEKLGVDDSERDLVKFEYGQVWSETEGTLVKIQLNDEV